MVAYESREALIHDPKVEEAEFLSAEAGEAIKTNI